MDAFLWASSNILNVNTVYKCKLKAKLMSELKPKEWYVLYFTKEKKPNKQKNLTIFEKSHGMFDSDQLLSQTKLQFGG